ncbi:MAG: hypothetical protein KJ811_01835 [Candidatus Margulisbacteria bacterium]|nr:hypothetical protein [Candidatus Margulisiibacteriota bacterium]
MGSVSPLFPEKTQRLPTSKLTWDQVATSFPKLGHYGLCGAKKKEQAFGAIGFHRIMQLVAVGTIPACQKLWQSPNTCHLVSQIIGQGGLTPNQKIRVSNLLATIDIKVVFFPSDPKLQGYIGIYKIISVGDQQRMEYSDFVNAQAWAEEEFF